jgi:hypothetical protein
MTVEWWLRRLKTIDVGNFSGSNCDVTEWLSIFCSRNLSEEFCAMSRFLSCRKNDFFVAGQKSLKKNVSK